MFFRAAENETITSFLHNGYAIEPVEAPVELDRIRAAIVAAAAQYLGAAAPNDHAHFLETIGDRVNAAQLNALRLKIIHTLMELGWFRAAYFACGRSLLETLIGNELAMQRSIGLSIQLPNDDSSLLPLHSDAWSEDSPFELVLWLPLVDVRSTMSMFVLPREQTLSWQDRIHDYQDAGVEAFYQAVEPDAQWLEVSYGNMIAFTHTLLHGNRVNREQHARWSINIRFKGLFTPYSDKRLGEFFDPITLRPASRIGLTYRLPAGFHA